MGLGQVFAESEIRASVVFQISKLCSLLLEAIRVVTGTPAWEVLVSGSIPDFHVNRLTTTFFTFSFRVLYLPLLIVFSLFFRCILLFLRGGVESFICDS